MSENLFLHDARNNARQKIHANAKASVDDLVAKLTSLQSSLDGSAPAISEILQNQFDDYLSESPLPEEYKKFQPDSRKLDTDSATLATALSAQLEMSLYQGGGKSGLIPPPSLTLLQEQTLEKLKSHPKTQEILAASGENADPANAVQHLLSSLTRSIYRDLQKWHKCEKLYDYAGSAYVDNHCVTHHKQQVDDTLENLKSSTESTIVSVTDRARALLGNTLDDSTLKDEKKTLDKFNPLNPASFLPVDSNNHLVQTCERINADVKQLQKINAALLQENSLIKGSEKLIAEYQDRKRNLTIRLKQLQNFLASIKSCSSSVSSHSGFRELVSQFYELDTCFNKSKSSRLCAEIINQKTIDPKDLEFTSNVMHYQYDQGTRQFVRTTLRDSSGKAVKWNFKAIELALLEFASQGATLKDLGLGDNSRTGKAIAIAKVIGALLIGGLIPAILVGREELHRGIVRDSKGNICELNFDNTKLMENFYMSREYQSALQSVTAERKKIDADGSFKNPAGASVEIDNDEDPAPANADDNDEASAHQVKPLMS